MGLGTPGNNWLAVWTRGAGTGGLGLAVEGPSEAKMSCMDNKDGSCSVEYIPYEAGTYSLNVTYGGHQVPGEEAGQLGPGWAYPLALFSASHGCHPSAPYLGSPFKVPVHDVTDASKVKCSGPGLSPGMVRANLPQSFQVDTSKAGVAPLQVKVQGPKGECPHTWGLRGGKARSSLRGWGRKVKAEHSEVGADVQAIDGGASSDGKGRM